MSLSKGGADTLDVPLRVAIAVVIAVGALAADAKPVVVEETGADTTHVTDPVGKTEVDTVALLDDEPVEELLAVGEEEAVVEPVGEPVERVERDPDALLDVELDAIADAVPDAVSITTMPEPSMYLNVIDVTWASSKSQESTPDVEKEDGMNPVTLENSTHAPLKTELYEIVAATSAEAEPKT